MTSKRSAGFSRPALDRTIHWPGRLKSALHFASRHSQIMTRPSIKTTVPVTKNVPCGGLRPMPKPSAAPMSSRWWKSPVRPPHCGGKNKGKTSIERIIYICSLEPDAARGDELLERIRRYWDIEGGLHQRLDVSGGEDASRVRNRNAILVLGILRRSAVGIFHHWRRHRKNLRQSTFKDFHDATNRFNHRLAFAPSPPAATDPVQKSAVNADVSPGSPEGRSWGSPLACAAGGSAPPLGFVRGGRRVSDRADRCGVNPEREMSRRGTGKSLQVSIALRCFLKIRIARNFPSVHARGDG